MPTTNLNIRTDKIVKENADKIYSELGLSMTTAVNLFLRATIRANGIPFDLKLTADKELSEAKLLLEGIEDIKNNNLIDGEKVLLNLEKNMEYKYQFTSHAEKDLDNILSYLEHNLVSDTAVRNFLEELRLTMENICLFPCSYKLIQNKYINNIAIRKALIMQYILYYSVDSVNKRIIIIRFSHSEQDADKFFKTMNINQ